MKKIKKFIFNKITIAITLMLSLISVCFLSTRTYAYTTDNGGNFNWNWQENNVVNKTSYYLHDYTLYVDTIVNDYNNDRYDGNNDGLFTDIHLPVDNTWINFNDTIENIVLNFTIDSTYNYIGINNGWLEFFSNNGNYGNYVYLRTESVFLNDMYYLPTNNTFLDSKCDIRVYDSTTPLVLPYTKFIDNNNNSIINHFYSSINDKSCEYANYNNSYFLYTKEQKTTNNGFLKYSADFDLDRYNNKIDFSIIRNTLINLNIKTSTYNGTPFQLIDYLSNGTEFLNSEQYTQMQQDYNTLISNYSQLQSDYSSLESQKDSLQNEINTLNNQKSNLQNDIFSLTNNYNQLESSYNQLQLQYQEILDNINNYVLKSDYDTLLEQYNTLNTNYTNLLAQYNDLVNAKNYGYWKYIDYAEFLINGSTSIDVPNTDEQNEWSINDLFNNNILKIGGYFDTTLLTIEPYQSNYDKVVSYINFKSNTPSDSLVISFNNAIGCQVVIYDDSDHVFTYTISQDKNLIDINLIREYVPDFSLYVIDMRITPNNAEQNGVYFANNDYIEAYNKGYNQATSRATQIYTQQISDLNNEITTLNNIYNQLLTNYQNLNGQYNNLQDSYNDYVSGNNFTQLFFTIAETPFTSFKTIWNVDFLGVNLAGFVTGILFVGLLIWVVKKIF